jgi:hypothetical protein
MTELDICVNADTWYKSDNLQIPASALWTMWTTTILGFKGLKGICWFPVFGQFKNFCHCVEPSLYFLIRTEGLNKDSISTCGGECVFLDVVLI